MHVEAFLQFTGDAMSPPVLGTLMMLCMAYILPSGDGKQSPFIMVSSDNDNAPSPKDAVDLDLTLSDSDSDSETVVLEEELPHVEMSAWLPGKNQGLISISNYMDSPVLKLVPCHHCKVKFGPEDIIYSWRCQHVSVIHYLHESCLLVHSEEDCAHSLTLTNVRGLLKECQPEFLPLIESLYRVEDDLVRIAVWDIDEEGVEGCCRPQKLRRC